MQRNAYQSIKFMHTRFLLKPLSQLAPHSCDNFFFRKYFFRPVVEVLSLSRKQYIKMDGPDIWDESSGVLELILGVKKNRTTLQRGQDRSSNSLRVVQRTRTTGCIIVRHENTRATLVRGLTSACKVAQHSYCLSCNYFSSRQSLKISEQHGFFSRPRCDHFVASGSYNKWYNGYNESYNGKNFESQAVVVCLATIVKGA